MYLYSDAGLQHEVGYFKNSMRQHLHVCVCVCVFERDTLSLL